MSYHIGLLVLRVGFGLAMVFGHGYGKLANFSKVSANFPDVIGVGSALSAGLATFAEFFCALAVVLGLFTRWAAIPVIITMAVAFGIYHAADPWTKKEMAFLYLLAFSTLVLTGPGKYSLDSKLGKL